MSVLPQLLAPGLIPESAKGRTQRPPPEHPLGSFMVKPCNLDNQPGPRSIRSCHFRFGAGLPLGRQNFLVLHKEVSPESKKAISVVSR